MAAPTLLFRDHAGSGHHLVSGMHDIGQIKHPSKAVCVREPVQMAFGVNLDVKVTGDLPGFVGLGPSQKSQGLESCVKFSSHRYTCLESTCPHTGSSPLQGSYSRLQESYAATSVER